MEWLAGIVGAVVGTIVTLVIQHMLFTHGTLRIDRSNPEKDIYRLDLHSLENLHKKKRITLKIDPNADLS